MKLNIKQMSVRVLLGLCILSFSVSVMAGTATSLTLLAKNVTGAFQAVIQLITAGSYIAGVAFALGAIMKFKQHKDNPTQIPIGTPISLLLIGAALIFFPLVLKIAGQDIFGSTSAIGTSGTSAPI